MEIEKNDVELDSTLDSDLDTDLENEELQDDGSDKDAQIAKLTAIIKRKNQKLAKLQETGKSDKPIIKKSNSSLDDSRLERLELKLDGIPEDVIDEILPLGGKKFLQTSIGKRVVEDLLAQRKAEQASDITSGGKSDINKKYSEAELRKMSSAELEKLIREN